MKKILSAIGLLATQLLAVTIVAVLIVGSLNSLFGWNLTLRIGPPGSPFNEIPTNFVDLAMTELILISIFLVLYAAYRSSAILAYIKTRPGRAIPIGILGAITIGFAFYFFLLSQKPPSPYDALLLAVLDNKPAAVQKILATETIDPKKSNEILGAALYNDPQILRALVQAGFDINAPDSVGETLLNKARKEQNTDIQQLLISLGAK